MTSPVRIGLSGNADANGVASIQVKAPPTLFAVLTLAAQCDGNPNWTVTAFGQPLAYGNGAQANLGPFLTSPGEVLTLSVTGATRGAQIIGTLAGTQHESAEEAAGYFKPTANPVTLNTFQGRQKLYPDGTQPSTANASSFTVASGGSSGQQIFTLPSGTVALRILVTANGLLFSYRLLMLGQQTSEQYFGDTGAPGSSIAVPVPTLPVTIPIEFDWDAKVIIQIDAPTQNVSVFVSALFTPEPPGQAGASQSVVEPTPSPWQAATSSIVATGTLLTGATMTLVAAAGSARIYVHPMTVVVTRVGGGLGFSQFVIRASSAADFAANNYLVGAGDAAGTRFQYTGDGGGAPTPAGDSLILKNTDTVTHDYVVSLAYAQAT